jgi:hypothetical protein
MPRKLKTVAIRIAEFGDMDRVDTQVAMAFGASVQPFTIITPVVSRDTIKSGGLLVRELIKSAKLILINNSLIWHKTFRRHYVITAALLLQYNSEIYISVLKMPYFSESIQNDVLYPGSVCNNDT